MFNESKKSEKEKGEKKKKSCWSGGRGGVSRNGYNNRMNVKYSNNEKMLTMHNDDNKLKIID